MRFFIKDCFVCKLLHKNRSEQLMAPLPGYRIKPREEVLSSVSLDYAGPYEVKRGRSLVKRWVCVFVCNVTSAVRIELVESLEATAFLNCLRRFLCLTGNKTHYLRSDCPTTFVVAKNILTQQIADAMKKANGLKSVQDFIKDAGITWDFSVTAASHHQGTLERQIRTFKEVCDGILGAKNSKRHPSDQRWSQGHKARGQGQGHKKIRGQGQPFRGQTLSRPRTGMLEAKAKDKEHKCKCSSKKKVFPKFFRRSPRKNVF